MLPQPRGEMSARLLDVLTGAPPAAAWPVDVRREPVGPVGDPLADEDVHLTLYLLYELHYRGLPGVDEGWEWNPGLLAWRSALEQVFTAGLREAVAPGEEAVDVAERPPIDIALRQVAEAMDGPSLSMYLRGRATLEQVREFLVHRSAYQLKEADPHSWAIPRLSGAAKAALVEIQYDEYGSGRGEWIHAELFARAMDAVGLDSSYGAYLELIPGVTLATVNLMSLFGLHRRWRGAIVGHLALFEMTSSIPNRRYGDGLRRLGLGEGATRFFDEHVTADAVHENIAAVDLAGGLLEQEPQLRGDVLWGARTLACLEERWARHLLDRWAAGRLSLLGEPATAPAPALAL